jgi:endo-cleaving rubber dioxygenase
MALSGLARKLWQSHHAPMTRRGCSAASSTGNDRMRFRSINELTVITLAALLGACGGGNYSGAVQDSGNPSGSTGGSGGTGGGFSNTQAFFAVKTQPSLAFCRNCHVSGGIADTDQGRRFMLSRDMAQDYGNLKSSWETLGKGIENNRILTKASNTDAEPHSAGAPWPKNSAAYENMKILLSCWEQPASCAALLAGVGGGDGTETPPLLGDLLANGGRNYAAVHCEGRQDHEPLPMDPRELITGENLNNPNFAVWYNDPFELCETPTLFENQAKQNALLVRQGKKPIYSAKLRPKTCGEWRVAVEKGRQYIMHNAITGEVLTRQSVYDLATYLGFNIPGDPQEASDLLARVALQRYGWPKHPYNNPFPMPGEDPNQTNGGNLQLPIALVQTRDDSGKWTGKVGVTCYACHIGQIGTGEVVGNSAFRDGYPELYGGSPEGTFVSLNGSNTDTGLALYDMSRASGTYGMGPNDFGTPLNQPGYMANRTRGSNAADQEIVNVLIGRDLDSLDWRANLPMAELLLRLVPSAPASGGDQDMPTWWWTHNKTRYLWVGFGSAGSSRGNFFPSSTNPNNGHWSKAREGDYQDLDIWLNAIEAPSWPDGYCSNANGTPTAADKPNCINRPLAEQGAILFHAKNLWAEDGNAGIPRPPVGNGSCAGCHGAYSPRYIHEPNYLPDPSLAGMSGATVPLDILGTDPAQSDLFTLGGSYRDAAGFSGPGGVSLNSSWFAYPDAVAGYRLPEEKTALEEASDDFSSSTTGTCGLRTLGGYTAQPLHGVWASGPYFHNGSVPTVWDVLKPSDRPNVWLRQQVPESEASPVLRERGFDTNMTRAYDYQKLGWKYQALACDALNNIPYLSCVFSEQVPTLFDQLMEPFRIGADYFSPPYMAAPGEGEVQQRSVYNTNAYSKGNEGHAFTQVLSDAERRALVEYLKTL